MPARKTDHIHRFKRQTYKSTGHQVYFCTNNCPTNFKQDVALTLGKQTLCNKCNKPFIMNEYSIRTAKPKCMSCINRRSSIPVIIPETEERREVIRRENDKELVQLAGGNVVNELNTAFNNLLVKEFNSQDEDDDL